MTFAYHPDNCPSQHWNRGDDICEDCGLNLNQPIEPDVQELLILSDEKLMLADWRSVGDKDVPANPQKATLSVTAHRIDLKLADGRSVWIEMEEGRLRVHAYTSPEHHDAPMNVDVLTDGFDLLAEDVPDAAGGDFTRTIRFPAFDQEDAA